MVGHMNVLFAYNDNTGSVQAMEPLFPDPPHRLGRDGGGEFEYFAETPTGAYVTRSMTYYQRPPDGGAELLIGFPQEYLLRKTR
jgi:hypothetical protein